MNSYPISPIPHTLEDLCEQYAQASGSHALRIASYTIKYFRNATLDQIEAQYANDFIRLRQTVLEAEGNVLACRAIYEFGATVASQNHDMVSQAAALAKLHVDRAFRLDGNEDHGSAYVGDIRDKLVEIAQLIKQALYSKTSRPILAIQTLTHLVHGLALIGANQDGYTILDIAKQYNRNQYNLRSTIELAEAELLACNGKIDKAIENAELCLGMETNDPLGLQVEVRQFLGTWYRAINNHEAASTHLRIATNLAYGYEMPALAIITSMELATSLAELGKRNELIEVCMKALETSLDLDLYNEVTKALSLILVPTLMEEEHWEAALMSAKICADRARKFSDVETCISLYELGAHAANSIPDYQQAQELWETCAALATGKDVEKARYLRLQAFSILNNEGIHFGQPLPFEGSDLCNLALPYAQAFNQAFELMDDALHLLISTPENEKTRGAYELANWNHGMIWLRSVTGTETDNQM